MNAAPRQVTLGVVAISRDEERDMPGFLENVTPWVDEVVIVDDGSTDRTCEIVRMAGGKVRLLPHRMTPDGGFSEQRNVGLAALQTDWVLNMDIDERVSPELAAEMLGAIGETRLNAFRYRRLNFFAHRVMRAGGWTSWNHPQLARRGSHHFEGALHERCVVEGAPGSVGQLENPMWHLNDESYDERIRKSLQYSRREADRLIACGRRVSPLELVFRPLVEFFKKYLVKRGLVDGVPGLIAALHAADAVFRAHALAWDEQNRISREDIEDEMRSMWARYELNKPSVRKVNAEHE